MDARILKAVSDELYAEKDASIDHHNANEQRDEPNARRPLLPPVPTMMPVMMQLHLHPPEA